MGIFPGILAARLMPASRRKMFILNFILQYFIQSISEEGSKNAEVSSVVLLSVILPTVNNYSLWEFKKCFSIESYNCAYIPELLIFYPEFISPFNCQYLFSFLSVKDCLLVGLHTCGDLAPNTLRIFASNSEIKGVCSVGCCYHLLSEEFENQPKGTKFSTYRDLYSLERISSCLFLPLFEHYCDLNLYFGWHIIFLQFLFYSIEIWYNIFVLLYFF